MPPCPTARALCLSVVATLSLLGAGCPQVDRQQVGTWREAVTAAREQAATTFETANALVRADQIARAEGLTAITEQDFTPGLDSDSVAKQMAAMDALTSYASAVEKLLDPELPAGVGAALTTAGEQIGATANVALLKSDAKLSAALGGLAKTIATAAAEKSARSIMKSADPDVSAVLQILADTLWVSVKVKGGPSATGGIYVTVKDAWDKRLTVCEADFKAAQPTGRRAIAERYADTLERRAAALQSIRALRASLIELAAGHTAAAQGRAADLQTVIAGIREQIATVKAVLSDIKKPPSH